ncbi:MAG: hydrogenase expression/formation protein [Rhodocyclales bacterium GWA2_65_20]|nr:MAG: hydrogenase expression/formation protein [Rhodocyclales bacterium GWA2_65_20]
MRAVVLGIGNTILTDEGVGVRAVEAFQQRYQLPENIAAIDGGTSSMELLDDLSDLDLLVVLDTIVAGKPPGTVIRLAGDDVPVFFRRKLSPHQIGLSDVLASLEFLGTEPKDIVVLGVQPVSLELGMELSPAVGVRVPELVEMAADEFAARGCALEPIAAEVL